MPRFAIICSAQSCDFENGFLTLLTEKLWTSEVLRRVKPAVAGLPVEVARPPMINYHMFQSIGTSGEENEGEFRWLNLGGVALKSWTSSLQPANCGYH